MGNAATSTTQTSTPQAGRPVRLAIKCTRDGQFSKRIRVAIAEHCADRLDQATISDAQLIASELVTNAFEHGPCGVVTLDILVEASTATLTVTSTGSSAAIPHPSLWVLPETTDLCGRGLALTRLVSRSVELHSAVAVLSDDWTAISANIGPAPVSI